MSKLRDDLWRVLTEPPNNMTHAGAWSKVDAILEQFDVSPKSELLMQDLGSMVIKANREPGSVPERGVRLLTRLEAAGFKIVRVSDEQ
jgi:hypothetical protein